MGRSGWGSGHTGGGDGGGTAMGDSACAVQATSKAGTTVAALKRRSQWRGVGADRAGIKILQVVVKAYTAQPARWG